MRTINKIKIDKMDACGNKSPISIMQESIKMIKNCDEKVEIEFNDYDFLVSLKYILKIMESQFKLRIEENGVRDGFISISIVPEC
ncbi:hypothetical protein Calag_0901 [Caldisphaera lagunensis DSM 15908]|uniref:Uncharacterized protein n=1 Tax=Caldisphaera lagunensis (strain DSM 15908 / JCM 11604 / ANMR 0165 / IC-154) TaxID=1056495 RepID=L0AC81_CALLD|nr:hypothetical protein [Caldisphaera lagunensis]AFZ70640.1 hypothetical protein Calag_0901 [Caldisphaera lagunensis DSM 15908]